MITGFDNAVVGMTIGDVKSINLTADQAYGQHQPEAVQPVPRNAFPPEFEFLVGEVVQGNGPQGPFLARILEERDEDVILDFNHPLAGEDLNFEIELLAVNDTDLDATADWSPTMLKSELLEVAKTRGLGVNTKSTKAQIIEALQG
jgi:FKBP-type peptidyl-prolyl cis-trans isomerase 2